MLNPLPPHLRKPPVQWGELRTCGAVKFHIDFCSHPSSCQQELAFEYSSDFSFSLLVVGNCTPGLTIAPGFAPELSLLGRGTDSQSAEVVSLVPNIRGDETSPLGSPGTSLPAGCPSNH